MKCHRSLILRVFAILPLLIFSGCKENEISADTEPPPLSKTKSNVVSGENEVTVSEAEADRIQQVNSDLRKQEIADEQVVLAANPVEVEENNPEIQAIELENEQLRQELELLQNQLVEQAVVQQQTQPQPQQDPRITLTSNLSNGASQNKGLLDKILNLQSQMKGLSDKRNRIRYPNQRRNPQATARPVSLKTARYGAKPPAINNVSYFYEPLSQHGNWIRSNQYGYVYSPQQGHDPNWNPYQNGRWGQTDYGHTWMSEEPHGWATTHYGRWDRNPGLGWLWVPGTEWGPAWVSWRANEQHAGWAPLPPQSGQQNAFQSDCDTRYRIPNDNYMFIGRNSLNQNSYRSHYLPRNNCREIYPQTRNITRIERQTGSPIHHYGLNNYSNNYRSNVPRYNVGFDCPEDGHHHDEQYGLGTHHGPTNNNDLIFRMMRPDAPRRSVPANFTKVNNPLFLTSTGLRGPSQPRKTTAKAPTTKRPAPKGPTTKRPAPKRPTTKRPVPKKPTTKRPAPGAPTTKRPAPMPPTTKRPAPKAPSTKRPVPKPPTTKRPVPKAPTTKRPVPKAPTTKRPVPKAPTTKRPVPKAPTTKRPVPKAPTTKRPVPKTPTKRPAPKTPTTKRPAPKAPTSKRPSGKGKGKSDSKDKGKSRTNPITKLKIPIPSR